MTSVLLTDLLKSLAMLSGALLLGTLLRAKLGIVYFIESLIVATGKSSYFLSGAITAVTAVLCYLAADDRSKAKPAKILLWASIILSLVGVIIALVSRENIMSIVTVIIDICIAVYMVKRFTDKPCHTDNRLNAFY